MYCSLYTEYDFHATDPRLRGSLGNPVHPHKILPPRFLRLQNCALLYNLVTCSRLRHPTISTSFPVGHNSKWARQRRDLQKDQTLPSDSRRTRSLLLWDPNGFGSRPLFTGRLCSPWNSHELKKTFQRFPGYPPLSAQRWRWHCFSILLLPLPSRCLHWQ